MVAFLEELWLEIEEENRGVDGARLMVMVHVDVVARSVDGRWSMEMVNDGVVRA